LLVRAGSQNSAGARCDVEVRGVRLANAPRSAGYREGLTKSGIGIEKAAIAAACRSFPSPKTGRTAFMAEHRKQGRPHKGPRRQFSVKVPDHLVEELDADAAQRGLDRTAWIVEAIAARLGQPYPFDTQERLTLTA